MASAATFRTDIQGLRAIAVAGVLIFHATSGRWLPGGFAGVDVFFVISGFLITRILVQSAGDWRSLADFYQRRARRLLPALGAMLIFVLAASAILLPAPDYAAAARMSVASLFFWSNMLLLRAPSYFDLSGDLKPLQHTWSLGVEEQFYLLFPLALMGMGMVVRRHLTSTVALATVASLAISVLLLAKGYETVAFYSLPSRAFELLIGALLALKADNLPNFGTLGRRYASLGGLAMIGCSFVLLGPEVPFPGLAALLPCAGAALVIASGIGQPSAGGRLISSAPFLFLGAISYSLYLWHWPLLVFARYWTTGPLDLATGAAVAAVSIFAAWASWRFIERPVLHARSIRSALTIAFSLTSLALAAGLVIVMAQGGAGRFSPAAQAMFAARNDYNSRRAECHADSLNPIPYHRTCIFGAGGARPAVAVWGNSQGAELTVSLGHALSRRGGAVRQITASACPPTIGYAPPDQRYCGPHNDAMLAGLSADPAIDHVILVARYDGREQEAAALVGGLERSVAGLMAAGKHVTLVGPLPTQDFDPPSALGLRVSQGRNPGAWGLTEKSYRLRNAAFLRSLPAMAHRHGANYLDPRPLLCGEGVCPAWRDGVGVLYFDAIHLSVSGADVLVPALLHQIDAAYPPVNRTAVGS